MTMVFIFNVLLSLSATIHAVTVLPSTQILSEQLPSHTIIASSTIQQDQQVIDIQQSSATTLEKRYRNVVVPTSKSSSTDAPPESWIRTISSTIVEVVHPTVIAGVTFSAKPTTYNGLTPWISLNKQGVPKTIMPKVKGGVTKDDIPDYKTYFQTATTIIHDNKNLKAHNLDEDDTFTEIKWIDEDDSYVSLNPLVRCTPDRYFNKGLAKDVTSEPFCTPAENSNLDMDKTYFITWYTRYFEEAKKVRIHLAYVKEKAKSKGMSKRDSMGQDLHDMYEIVKKDSMLASGTKLAFFSSDWMINRDGYFPLTVDEKFLKGQYSKNAIITIQPDYIDDEDFDLLSNGVVVNLRKGAVVAKKSKEQLALEDDGIGDDENKYIVLMTMPTVVVVACCIMYFLTQLCSGDRDVASIRRKYYKSRFHKVLGKPKKLFKKSKSKKGYNNLPQFEEHEMNSYKQN
ncbi:Psg1 protein [Saccharomycopsis crataegensis]|uniref:Psg1 protein n=1 Tax=Saccharomycopsis crataegensis TaxID=43959 RepID=A0AAV5QNV9_9ASCO|nr:Psg1 protein [Saccharomycopsis crataegensis]